MPSNPKKRIISNEGFFIDVESFCANDFLDSLHKYRLHGKKTEIFKYTHSNDGKWNDPERESAMLSCIKKESPDFQAF